MKYLRGYTRNILRAINFLAYQNKCESIGGEWKEGYTTLFLFDMIQHPSSNDYALVISEEDEQYLEEDYVEELENHEEMELEGWFEKIEKE